MRYISDKEFKKKLQQIRQDNKSEIRKSILYKEKNKYKKSKSAPSTSKMILFGAIILCLEIVLFCEYVILKFQDTSALYVLIGIPASLIPVIMGYYSKAKAENTAGGITYEMAMKENCDSKIESEEAVG